jgi:hypothetical protein
VLDRAERRHCQCVRFLWRERKKEWAKRAVHGASD